MTGKIKQFIETIQRVDPRGKVKAQERLDQLTKPLGSLGRLEALAAQLVAMREGRDGPLARRLIVVFAGDHGVVAEGVSAYPQEVTTQMVKNFLAGGAAISVLARGLNAELYVVDMGVNGRPDSHPRLIDKKVAGGTRNFAQGPAMTREEAERAVEAGMEVFETLEAQHHPDVVIPGDMGIGNTTASSAVIAALTGAPIRRVVGVGTGLDAAGTQKKIAVIEAALAKHRPDAQEALDVLAKVGGFELGGISGFVLAAAAQRVPIVLDGLISTAGALLAARLQPAAAQYCLAGHCSQEPGHRVALDALGLEPVLDLDMRLGEGTGAALAVPVLEAALHLLREMATFASAGVSTREKGARPIFSSP